jgi:hypothetical protein
MRVSLGKPNTLGMRTGCISGVRAGSGFGLMTRVRDNFFHSTENATPKAVAEIKSNLKDRYTDNLRISLRPEEASGEVQDKGRERRHCGAESLIWLEVHLSFFQNSSTAFTGVPKTKNLTAFGYLSANLVTMSISPLAVLWRHCYLAQRLGLSLSGFL